MQNSSFWRKACEIKLFACCIYLVFKKTFDTVSHEICLYKLHHYGIRGIANNWIKLSLVNRNQYTYIYESNSTPHHISYGVPQGLVLDLFILFLNDLHISVKRSKVHHFVNNINLLLRNKLHKKINKSVNRDLALLVKWLRSNKTLHC